MNVGIVKDDIFLEHITDDYHPENPGRLKSIYTMLNSIDNQGVEYIPPRMATHEEIYLIHEPSYVESIAAIYLLYISQRLYCLSDCRSGLGNTRNVHLSTQKRHVMFR